MHKDILQAMAESFAHISRLESACYHYLLCVSSSKLIYRNMLQQAFIDYLSKQSKLPYDYIVRIVDAALIELTHTAPNKDGYAWTTTDRLLATNIPRTSYYRHHCNDYYNAIIDTVLRLADKTHTKTQKQIIDYYRPSCIDLM